MIHLNYERNDPSTHVHLSDEIKRQIKHRRYLDRNPISGHDSFHGSLLTRHCRIARTFRVPFKHYRRIFQNSHMWNFTQGSHAIVELDSNVD